MMRLTTLLSISSFLILAACADNRRPDAMANWVNKPALKLVGYNLKSDYDSSGNRLPNAKPKEQLFKTCEDMLQALNVSVCFSPKDQKEVKRAIKESQDYIQLLKDRCGMSCWGL